MNFKQFAFQLFLLVTLSSCSTLNQSSEPEQDSPSNEYLSDTFTTEKIMKTHEGMTADSILKMYGDPKNISQAVCGGETSGRWNCTTWEYGKFPYDRASFTFNSNSKVAILNNFSVERKGVRLPATFTTENSLKIRQGMSSKKVLELFGYPVSVNQAVCGASAKELWICTTWEYGEFPHGNASFTFSGKHNALILNNFKIDKD